MPGICVKFVVIGEKYVKSCSSNRNNWLTRLAWVHGSFLSVHEEKGGFPVWI